MPLHNTEELKAGPTSQLESEVLNDQKPDLRVPRDKQDPQTVYQTIHDQLILDGNSQQNLATFCTTWIEPEVMQLMDESADKNMIDKDEYPQTAAIEERCVHMLADLWNSPEAASTIGCSTTGSSEAAMLGGLALKWNWRKRQRANGKSTDAPNLIMGPVQVCWHKFCRYFDVEIREVPMEGDRLLLTPEEVIKRCDENTIGVIVTLGVTFTLQFEPVHEISLALDKLQAETGLDIPIHVDGASGAFLAPFIQPDLLWDFRLPRVKSINASGHKFGLAPLGVGWALWREKHDLPEELIFDVNYLGGNMPTFALNFSRPGGEIICQYYNFLRLGKEGYREIQTECYALGRYLAEKIAELRALPDHLRRPRRNPRPVLGTERPGILELHALRLRRSLARARLAGSRLLHAAQPRRSRHPAHPRPPRLYASHGRRASSRNERRSGPLSPISTGTVIDTRTCRSRRECA